MDHISWGIIGCGDVTEVKSGPAFNKVPFSSLHAVMRRDKDKAADYARRHHVAAWYSSAEDLINDPMVNAVYIATPPNVHEEYALAAIAAGKPVYIEKPISVNYDAATRIAHAANSSGVKLVVAHYRRAQPIFRKMKDLIDEGVIGKPYLAEIKYFRAPATQSQLENPGLQWRLDPLVSGGGLFHDLAPHQIDLLLYFFGLEVHASCGFAINTGRLYPADDLVTGIINFNQGVVCSGTWNFNALETNCKDELCIYGAAGKIKVQVFQHETFVVESLGKSMKYRFDTIKHVQQPMIEQVVQYFLGFSNNPCPAEEAAICMQIMDNFTKSSRR